MVYEKKSISGSSVDKEHQSVIEYKHQKSVHRNATTVCMSCTHGSRIKPRTQTCHSASSLALPPPVGSLAQVQRWRGCSGAYCPCPSAPGVDFAGMMCLGQVVAAPVSGYTAEAAWWGSPVGSEDEEKPLRTQAGAPEKQDEQDIRNTETSLLLPTKDDFVRRQNIR